MASGASNSSLSVPIERSLRRRGQALHAVMCGGMTRDDGLTLKQEEVYTRYMEKHFNHEDSQAVDHVSQGTRAVSTRGGFQDLTV